jgi:hypothetical protein
MIHLDDEHHWRLQRSKTAFRIRAGLRVGRMEVFGLKVNARSAEDPWIREVCRLELERRKELEQ